MLGKYYTTEHHFQPFLPFYVTRHSRSCNFSFFNPGCNQFPFLKKKQKKTSGRCLEITTWILEVLTDYYFLGLFSGTRVIILVFKRENIHITISNSFNFFFLVWLQSPECWDYRYVKMLYLCIF